MRDFKASKTAEEFLERKTMALKPVLEYAYNLEFEEEPEYEKLKFMLKKILLDENMIPIDKFDWSFDHPKIAD